MPLIVSQIILKSVRDNEADHPKKKIKIRKEGPDILENFKINKLQSISRYM